MLLADALSTPTITLAFSYNALQRLDIPQRSSAPDAGLPLAKPALDTIQCRDHVGMIAGVGKPHEA